MEGNLDFNKRSTLILMDTFTQNSVNFFNYETMQVPVITDVREITEAYRSYKLILFEPALFVIVTREVIEELKRSFSIQVTCVYNSDEAVDTIRDIATLIKCDYTSIDWNLVYGIIQSDAAILEPYLNSISVIDSYKYLRDKIPKDLVEYFDRFRGSYLQLVSKVSTLIDENKNIKYINDAQKVLGDRAMAGIKELKELLDEATDKIHSYEVLLSDSYDKIFTGFYPDRPNILYIKSISHLGGIDTFINVLFSVITTQYKMSCKVVKLVDEGNARVIRYIPGTYKPITDTYNTSEVLDNDFIMKLSNYEVMLDLLMMNRSNLNYLIIHDMRNSLKDAIDTALVTVKINELSADFAAFEEYDNILSDLDKQVAFYWSYTDCKKFSGSDIIKLSNHPTIAKVIDLLL